MDPTYPLPEFSYHWDSWAVVFLLAVSYWWAEKRIRPLVAPNAPAATRNQWIAWYSGVLFFWLVSDWPVHDLAEETLFSVHMVEHLIIGYVLPALLLVGMPRWMGDATLGHPRVAPVVRVLANPILAFFTFNTVLVGLHWPEAIQLQNTSELGHFALHALMFGAGVMLWLPVLSPTPEVPRISRPAQMLYLALTTIIPTVPASFLTFSDTVIYPSYGDAALTWGLTAIEDQTIAGLIMKIGAGVYLIGILAGLWFRWIAEEREWDRMERELVRQD